MPVRTNAVPSQVRKFSSSYISAPIAAPKGMIGSKDYQDAVLVQHPSIPTAKLVICQQPSRLKTRDKRFDRIGHFGWLPVLQAADQFREPSDVFRVSPWPNINAVSPTPKFFLGVATS